MTDYSTPPEDAESAAPAASTPAPRPPTPFAVLQAARTIESLNRKTVDDLNLPAVVDELNVVFCTTDYTPIASMLAVHAHVLDSVFNTLLTTPDPYFERSLQVGMALRAHRQCLDTLNTLAALMNPQPKNSSRQSVR